MWGVFMFYVREADKLNLIDKMFNRIRVEDNQILLPLDVGGKSTTWNGSCPKWQILARKTKGIVGEFNGNKIVLSKEVR